MTREELRKEAIMTVEWECTPMIDRPLFVHAYITGAEPREKRIAELEAKIEEIKKDVYECFGYEYNILVTKLLNKWGEKRE